MKKIVLSIIGLTLLTGCNPMQRISNIGRTPSLSQIENPQKDKNLYPVSMPTPQPRMPHQGTNSLWKAGAKAFFRDQRAREVGDLLTISVNLNETADIANNTKRSRNSSDKIGVDNFMGLESKLSQVLPDAVDPAKLVGFSSTPTHEGKGSVKRSEKLQFKLAAVVTQILPNGNLVVSGRQEIRVNYEVRELLITGVIRPQDVSANNEIDSTKIAEARISYGGRGQLSDVQRAPWGQELVDTLSPF